jgi:hypothetical protein
MECSAAANWTAVMQRTTQMRLKQARVNLMITTSRHKNEARIPKCLLLSLLEI